MRLLPFLLFAPACALLRPPVAATPAACAGFALGPPAAEVLGQIIRPPNDIPGFTIDVSECIDFGAPPLTCEEQSAVHAWVQWSAGLADGVATEISNPDGVLTVPSVLIAECP